MTGVRLKDWLAFSVRLRVPPDGQEFTIDSWHPSAELADFIWNDGNYACDCNRSLFIREQCDPSFAELPCGDTIELLALTEAPA